MTTAQVLSSRPVYWADSMEVQKLGNCVDADEYRKQGSRPDQEIFCMDGARFIAKECQYRAHAIFSKPASDQRAPYLLPGSQAVKLLD